MSAGQTPQNAADRCMQELDKTERAGTGSVLDGPRLSALLPRGLSAPARLTIGIARIGTSWFNFTRFWRLVLENPDPTGGNFLEQIPKLTIWCSFS